MRTCSRNAGRVFSAVGLLLSGLLLACSASPAQVAGPGQGTKRESQNVSNNQLREGLHTLQATKTMLQSADHDYGGHRVAAIKAIDAAEHQLRLALRSQQKGKNAVARTVGKTGKPGPRRGNQPEPQNISNMQLADAIGTLEKTQTLLDKSKRDYGGHRVAAVRDLGAAVQQLQVALKYEKKKKG
ncbi:MAG: hypothetical protein ACYC3I_03685 [Gemmataceae bacterium]